MIYRRFGKTELSMPLLSCGGMRYQFDWKDKPLDVIPDDNQKNLEATILRAFELGINHIETARGYGSSERQLGEILPQLPRDQIIVQTKIGPNENPDTFAAEFQESLERMKLDYVDLLALHGINHQPTYEWSIRPGGCLSMARKLQEQGLARHIGFSTHGPVDIIVRAIQHEDDGGFDYVNLHWYYINQQNWPAIEAAASRDMGVFIISPSDKGGMLYKSPPKLLELTKPLHPIVFNDLFCLSRPQVHTISVGASRPGDFDLHLQALPLLAQPLEHLEPVIERLKNAVRSAVGEEFIDPLNLNLPHWQECPGQLNVKIIVWLWTLMKAYGMEEYGHKRYNLMGNADHWFPGASPGDINESDWIAISKKAGLGTRLIDILNEANELFGGENVKRLTKSCT